MEFKTFTAPLVFLDLKDFINLAQDVKNGKPQLFDRIASLMDARKAFVITTGSLYLEIFEIGAAYRRNDIHRIIKRLTQNFILKDIETIRYLEVNEALSRQFKVPGNALLLPLAAIEQGYIHSLGRATVKPADAKEEKRELALKIAKECEAYMLTDEFFEELVNVKTKTNFDPEGEMLRSLRESTERTREEWKDRSFAKKEKICIMTMERKMLDLLDKVVPEMKFNRGDLKVGMFDPCLLPEFIRTIPTLNMWSKMYLYLYHKDLTARVEPNDLIDITHLSVAVPYCDVVVCDKKMASVLRASKLDQQYNTRVFPRLGEAVDEIEKITATDPRQ